jgi:hypothetical protein
VTVRAGAAQRGPFGRCVSISALLFKLPDNLELTEFVDLFGVPRPPLAAPRFR